MHKPNPATISKAIAIGLTAGLLSGLLGIGGGVILVPALLALLGVSQAEAQGTSLALFTLPVAALGAYTYWHHGHVDLFALPSMAVGFLLGGFMGGKLAVKLPAAILSRIFAIALIVFGIKMLIS